MIIDPVSRVLGHMAHEQINTFPVGPGAIQFGFKGVAAFVRGMVQLQGLHNIRPKYPVLGLIANLPVVADQPGATFGKPPFNQWPDLWMDGNNAVLTGFRFGAALHRAFLQVYIFRFQVQKFRDTPPGI